MKKIFILSCLVFSIAQTAFAFVPFWVGYSIYITVQDKESGEIVLEHRTEVDKLPRRFEFDNETMYIKDTRSEQDKDSKTIRIEISLDADEDVRELEMSPFDRQQYQTTSYDILIDTREYQEIPSLS